MNAKTPSIVIADDHLMFREALKSLLEAEGFKVVGEASEGREAVRLVRKLDPSVALLDCSMPLLNGIEAAQEIQKQSPGTPVVLLTMYDSDAYAVNALKYGVRGYVLKRQPASELIGAIREVLGGAVYLSPGISEAVVKAMITKEQQPSELLTSREKQVLQLIAEGKSTKDVAEVLNLSVKTAESHRSHIMQRLDIHNVAGLVRFAIREGVIQP